MSVLREERIMQEKLISNLRRYSQIAIWSDKEDIETTLGLLFQNSIFVSEVFTNQSLITNKFNSLKCYKLEEIEKIESPCLLIIASQQGYIVTQDLYIKLGERVSIINYDSFSDFYEGQYGVISKFARPSRVEDLVFDKARINPNISNVNAYAKLLVRRMPIFKTVEIETFNRCNGTCSFCPVNKYNDSRKPYQMDEDLFADIISQLQKMQYNGRVCLYSNNEPLLDERIVHFSKQLYEALPYAKVHMFTNGTLLNEEKFLSLISYLDELIIDNYNDDLVLLSNVRDLYENYKNAPFFNKVKFVLRLRNDMLSTRGGYAPNRTKLPDFSDASCVLPFVQMIIRPDGTVGLCCNAPLSNMVLGRLDEHSLLDIWYGLEYQSLRNSILQGRCNVEKCKYCDAFQFY